MDLDWFLVLGMLWGLALLITALRSLDKPFSPPLSTTRAILIIFSIAVIARLLPSSLLPVGASYDIQSFEIVANLLRNQQDVYTSAEALGRHPYLPLQMYWMCFANQIALNSGWSFTKVVRLLPILADSIIAVIVFLALIKLREEKNAWKAGLFYALNPVTIMVSAYHGQFDALPCLFILLAWFFLRFQPTRRPWVNFLFSSLSLGAAILSKSWPIFFLPLLIAKLTNWKMRLKYIGLVGAVPLAGLIAYSLLIGGDIFNPIRIAISYSHGTGIWGYTYLLRLGVQNDLFGSGVYAFIQEYGRWMTLLMLTIIMMKAVKTKDSMDGILLIILSLYAFGHIFSIQYLAWIVPFAVLSQRLSWLRRYILAATPYMLLAYFTLILAMRIDNLIPWPEADMALIIPVGLVPWIISVAWFINHWMFAADRTSLEIREA